MADVLVLAGTTADGTVRKADARAAHAWPAGSASPPPSSSAPSDEAVDPGPRRVRRDQRIHVADHPELDGYLVAPKAEALVDVVRRTSPSAVLVTAGPRGHRGRRPGRRPARLRHRHRRRRRGTGRGRPARDPVRLRRHLDHAEPGGARDPRSSRCGPTACCRRGDPGDPVVEPVAVEPSEAAKAARITARTPKTGSPAGRTWPTRRSSSPVAAAIGSAEAFGAHRAAGRRARRGRRRFPRRHRPRLVRARLPGRPDRQDRRPAALPGRRHLRRHPAPRRHAGIAHDRRDQQGPEGADLLHRRLRRGRRPAHAVLPALIDEIGGARASTRNGRSEGVLVTLRLIVGLAMTAVALGLAGRRLVMLWRLAGAPSRSSRAARDGVGTRCQGRGGRGARAAQAAAVDRARRRARPRLLGLPPAHAHPRRGVRRAVRRATSTSRSSGRSRGSASSRTSFAVLVPGRRSSVFVAIRVVHSPRREGPPLALLRLTPRCGVVHAVHDLQRRVDPAALPRRPDQRRRSFPLPSSGALRLGVGRRPARAARRGRPTRSSRRSACCWRSASSCRSSSSSCTASTCTSSRLPSTWPSPAARGPSGRCSRCTRDGKPVDFEDPGRGRPDGSRDDRGLHLEGPARLRDLHRVRTLPVAVPGVEHRQAAVAEAAGDEAARPRPRQGAVPPRRPTRRRGRPSRVGTRRGRAPAGGRRRRPDGVIDPDVLWSCTTCGACVEQCPVDIEHVDHVVDMRRYQVLMECAFPESASPMLRNLEHAGDPWGRGAALRAWSGPTRLPSRCRSWVPTGTDAPGRRRVPVLGRLRGRPRRHGPSAPRARWPSCCTRPGCRSWCSARPRLHRRPGPPDGARVPLPDAGAAERRDAQRGRRAHDRRHLRPLLQHPGQRVPPARRALRGRPPHPAAGPARGRGAAHAGAPGRRDDHLPRRVLPGPAQPDLRRHPASSSGSVPGATVAEMPRNRERSFCCGAGGARMWMDETIGTAHQREPHRRGAGPSSGPGHRGLPVLHRDALATASDSASSRDALPRAVEVTDVSEVLLRSVRGLPDDSSAPATTSPREGTQP